MCSSDLEELWQRLATRNESISRATYPAHEAKWLDAQGEADMALLQDIIVNIRNMRAEMKVDAKKKIPVQFHGLDDAATRAAGQNRLAIERLSMVSTLEITSQPLAEAGGAVRSAPRYGLRIALADAVDPAAERARIDKEKQKLEKESVSLANQLGNENFLAKAPAHVVEGLRKRSAEVAALLVKIAESLKNLG